MSKSMHVQFADGTSHTYDDVPDDVTQDQVNARAANDFPSRQIGAVAEGAHPEAAPLPTQEEVAANEPSIAAKIGGAAQTGFDLANQFVQTPVGKIAAEYVLPTTVGAKILKGAFGNKGAVPPQPMPAAPAAAPVAPAAPAAAPRPGMMPQGGGPVPPTTPPMTSVPGAPGGMTPPTSAAANEGWISKALQSAKQYTAPIESVAGKAAPMLKGMSKLAWPAALASELFYTSPEEIEILKKAEAEKRAKGWKPINER